MKRTYRVFVLVASVISTPTFAAMDVDKLPSTTRFDLTCFQASVLTDAPHPPDLNGGAGGTGWNVQPKTQGSSDRRPSEKFHPMLATFFLGRLSARDESVNWIAVSEQDVMSRNRKPDWYRDILPDCAAIVARIAP